MRVIYTFCYRKSISSKDHFLPKDYIRATLYYVTSAASRELGQRKKQIITIINNIQLREKVIKLQRYNYIKRSTWLREIYFIVW